MDLTFSDHQRLLQDSAARLTADLYSFEKRSALLATAEGFDREMWVKFAELGWLALAIPETAGGLGGSAADINILMECFGKALALEPFLSTIVLSCGLIAGAATEAQRDRLIPNVIAGKTLLAFAHSEKTTRVDPNAIRTCAKRSADGWTLCGEKVLALGGPAADYFIVSARIGTEPGIGLFLIPPNSPGLHTVALTTLDGQRASNLELSDTPVAGEMLLGGFQSAGPIIEECVDRAIVAASAAAVGCMGALLEKTADYIKIRVQFGEPLSNKQVLRHRVAEMALRLEEAKASVLHAALVIDRGATVSERSMVSSAAKVKAGRAGRFVAEQAIQLHGGMGVTEELDIGSYFRSLVAFDLLFGSADYHRRRYAKCRSAMPTAT